MRTEALAPAPAVSPGALSFVWFAFRPPLQTLPFGSLASCTRLGMAKLGAQSGYVGSDTAVRLFRLREPTATFDICLYILLLWGLASCGTARVCPGRDL